LSNGKFVNVNKVEEKLKNISDVEINQAKTR